MVATYVADRPMQNATAKHKQSKFAYYFLHFMMGTCWLVVVDKPSKINKLKEK